MDNLTKKQLEDFADCKYRDCQGCSNAPTCRDGNGYWVLVDELRHTQAELETYRVACDILGRVGYVIGEIKSTDEPQEAGQIKQDPDTAGAPTVPERLPSPMRHRAVRPSGI